MITQISNFQFQTVNGYNMDKKVAVMGVGNVLLKDEGIGARVVEEIRASYRFDKRVRLVDGGTGGYSLIYQIKDSDFLIMVDAVDIGVKPGSIVKYKLDGSHATGFYGGGPESPEHLSPHQIGILDVINISRTLYGHPEVVKIIGIQPLDMSFSSDLEVTPEIRSIIPKVVSHVLKEINALGVSCLA